MQAWGVFKCSKTDDECVHMPECGMTAYNTCPITDSMLSASVLFVFCIYSVLLDVTQIHWTSIIYYM